MELSTFTHSHLDGWSAPVDALDSDRTLVIALAAPGYIERPAALEELRARLPRSVLVGCSSAGEIFGTSVADDSIAVAAVRLEEGWVRSALTSVEGDDDSFAAGQRLGGQLAASTLRAVLVFSDGLRVNGSSLVRGLNEALPPGVVVTGGLAADGDRFERTWVLTPDGARSGQIVAVGLHGDRLKIGHGSKGGWDIFGPERMVTRSRGNVLYELDGKPALRLYKNYLGERAGGLPATALLFPLALRQTSSASESVVRTILAVNEDEESMTFAGDIPEGSLAQLMRANFDRLVDGAGAAALATEAPSSAPVLALAISCVGRRLVLGERAEEEVEATLEALPAGAKQIGFYSYGEISPHASGRCELHNQTMTLTTIAEP